MPIQSGIYRIINIVNDHVYVGSAVNLHRRKREHFCGLKNKSHINTYLQNAFNLYSEKSFIFDIIEYCEKEKLIEKEQFWMDSYRLQGSILYNVCPTAGSPLGRKLSEETKLKISAALKGHQGIHHTEETKKKMSDSRRGKPNGRLGEKLSEEHKKKIAESLKGKPHKGHPLSEKAKENLAKYRNGNQNMLGKHHTEEARKKISEAGMGNSWNKGYHHTEEARRNMSKATKLAWQKRKEKNQKEL